MGHDDVSTAGQPWSQEEFTRRELLKKGAVVAGASALLPGVLAARAGAGGPGGGVPSSGYRPISDFAGTPSHGGVLRIAMLGNGPSETFDPGHANGPIDFLHAYSAFDPMVRFAPHYRTEPGLVLEWNPNGASDVYELKLRPGVTWHDGKPFTADDLIYTLRWASHPDNIGSSSVENLRLNELKKLNDHLVRVPLRKPNARLQEQFAFQFVVQDGAKDFSKPVGTGPFKLESFTPGKQAVLTANRDYWDHPRPYVDRLEILSVDDDTARLGALQSGQAHIIWPFPAAQARSALASPPRDYGVFLTLPGLPMSFYVRCDQAPTNDVRVRTALKLAIDRRALIEAAFSGFGTVANDIPGEGLPFYDKSLPQRPHDPDQARSLLKAAGRSDLRLRLYSSPAFAGQLEAATAFVQQAKQAGIKIDLKIVPPSQYFNPTQLWLKMGFGQSVWPVSSLQVFYFLACLSNSSLDESHYRSASFDRLYDQAVATSGPREQALWNRVQKVQYDQGGNMFWVNRVNILGVNRKVRGIEPGSGWIFEIADATPWKWGFA